LEEKTLADFTVTKINRNLLIHLERDPVLMSLARNVMPNYRPNVKQDGILTHFVLIHILPFYSLRDPVDQEQHYMRVIVL
jgi:hypothetical protein